MSSELFAILNYREREWKRSIKNITDPISKETLEVLEKGYNNYPNFNNKNYVLI